MQSWANTCLRPSLVVSIILLPGADPGRIWKIGIRYIPSISLSICMSVCISVWLSVCVCKCLSMSLYMSDRQMSCVTNRPVWLLLAVYQSVYLHVCLSVCQSICLSVCLSLSACLSVCLSVSVCLFACLSACLSLWHMCCVTHRPVCLYWQYISLSLCLYVSLYMSDRWAAWHVFQYEYSIRRSRPDVWWCAGR